jgi:hypothetical protein
MNWYTFFGYPCDRHIVVDDREVSPKRREVTAAIRPDIFSGQVMAGPNFLTKDFDPDRHYLVPYKHPKSRDPRGFSGAAVWWEPREPLQVWRPNYRFAGVCTHAYEKGTVERIVIFFGRMTLIATASSEVLMCDA